MLLVAPARVCCCLVSFICVYAFPRHALHFPFALAPCALEKSLRLDLISLQPSHCFSDAPDTKEQEQDTGHRTQDTGHRTQEQRQRNTQRTHGRAQMHMHMDMDMDMDKDTACVSRAAVWCVPMDAVRSRFESSAVLVTASVTAAAAASLAFNSADSASWGHVRKEGNDRA